MANTSSPAATTIGIPRERARIAPCETGLPWAVTIARDPRWIEPGRRAGLRSVATTTPWAALGSLGASPAELRSHLFADAADVRGAGSQIWVGRRDEPRRRSPRRRDAMPVRRRHLAVIDCPQRSIDELVVGEQEEVSVEDGGLVLRRGECDVSSG